MKKYWVRAGGMIMRFEYRSAAEDCAARYGVAVNEYAAVLAPLDTFAAWEAEVARLGKHYDPNADMAINDALGLAGEVGEVVELIKKDRYQAQPLDKAKLCLELGDVLWYLTNMAAGFGLTLEDVANANRDKLRKRYPDGFTPGGGVR